MIKLRLQTWLAVGFLGAASLVAASASAVTSNCQRIGTTWTETVECHGGTQAGGQAWGSVDSSNNKVLNTWLINGNYVGGRGLAANGSLVSTCSAIDSTADLNSVSDNSGCNSATHIGIQYSIDL